MKKTFHFVDTGSSNIPNKTTRKSARSHVMKGKNAGKTIHRRSRLDSCAERTPCNDASVRNENRRQPNGPNTEESGPVARNLGNVLRTIRFPVELNESSLKSIDQFFIFITEKMYPSQLKLASHEYKYDWLKTTFIDADASYCSLALIASTNEFFLSGGISSPKALFYLSNTLSLVQRRMQSEEALTDSTLCMVMMLILQEQIRHEKASQIHYEGLRKMIKLRRRLSQPDICSTLLLKMSKMDILYALRYGKPVTFFRDRMSDVRRTLPSLGVNFSCGLDTDLEYILVDVKNLATLFNNPSANQTLDISTFLEIVISICCRLIRFRPLQSPKPDSNREAAYHIGLITFMTTLFLQWDSRRIKEYGLISRRLREVLDEDFDTQNKDLHLWLLFIAILWFSPTDTHWLIPKITILAAQLDIDSWSKVRDIICKFPWINVLHEQTSYTIWDLVCQRPHRDS